MIVVGLLSGMLSLHGQISYAPEVASASDSWSSSLSWSDSAEALVEDPLSYSGIRILGRDADGLPNDQIEYWANDAGGIDSIRTKVFRRAGAQAASLREDSVQLLEWNPQGQVWSVSNSVRRTWIDGLTAMEQTLDVTVSGGPVVVERRWFRYNGKGAIVSYVDSAQSADVEGNGLYPVSKVRFDYAADSLTRILYLVQSWDDSLGWQTLDSSWTELKDGKPWKTYGTQGADSLVWGQDGRLVAQYTLGGSMWVAKLSWSYDGEGRLLSQSYEDPDRVIYQTQWHYDAWRSTSIAAAARKGGAVVLMSEASIRVRLDLSRASNVRVELRDVKGRVLTALPEKVAAPGIWTSEPLRLTGKANLLVVTVDGVRTAVPVGAPSKR